MQPEHDTRAQHQVALRPVGSVGEPRVQVLRFDDLDANVAGQGEVDAAASPDRQKLVADVE